MERFVTFETLMDAAVCQKNASGVMVPAATSYGTNTVSSTLLGEGYGTGAGDFTPNLPSTQKTTYRNPKGGAPVILYDMGEIKYALEGGNASSTAAGLPSR